MSRHLTRLLYDAATYSYDAEGINWGLIWPMEGAFLKLFFKECGYNTENMDALDRLYVLKGMLPKARLAEMKSDGDTEEVTGFLPDFYSPELIAKRHGELEAFGVNPSTGAPNYPPVFVQYDFGGVFYSLYLAIPMFG